MMTHTLPSERIQAIKDLALRPDGIKDPVLLSDAKQICAGLLADDPANVDYLYVMGMLVYQMGDFDEAASYLERVLVYAPDRWDAAYHYALIASQQGKRALAKPLFRRVVRQKPDHAKAHYFLANILKDEGAVDEALAAYNEVVALNPSFLEAYNNRGNLLKDLGRLDEAFDSYQQALALQKDHPLVLNNLGVVYFHQGKLDEAAALHLKALSIDANYPEAQSNLGMIARLQGNYDAAIAYCLKALALRADYPEALNNLGNSYKDLCRFDEAIDCYQKALALRPDYGDVHNNLAMALLSVGRFAEGWDEQEWRWRTAQLGGAAPRYRQPMWQGEDLAGKTLLVHAEQGFGDTLQFCRYAPLIKAKGARVIYEVPRRLARLIRSLSGVDQVVTYGDQMPDFDFYISMMSLPRLFSTNAENVPAAVPYLHPEAEDVAKWGARMAQLDPTLRKVGLVWAGSARTQSPDLIATDACRSLSADALMPLIDVPGIAFFSLQKEGTRAPDSFNLINWIDDCIDFSDTAALVSHLDLVITVDTAMAHLAGAVGCKVWMLNRYNSCWRWLVERNDTPWYPTMRLFRQTQIGVWTDVIERVRATLLQG